MHMSMDNLIKESIGNKSQDDTNVRAIFRHDTTDTQTLKHITHTQTNKLACLSDILRFQLKGLVDNNEYNSPIHGLLAGQVEGGLQTIMVSHVPINGVG